MQLKSGNHPRKETKMNQSRIYKLNKKIKEVKDSHAQIKDMPTKNTIIP